MSIRSFFLKAMFFSSYPILGSVFFLSTFTDNEVYAINEQATLKYEDMGEVYDKCISWLKIVNAKVIEKKRPTFIKAKHGRGEGIWMKDTGKHFIIQLSKKNVDVIINFKIPHLKWVFSWDTSSYYYWWFELVEDLWSHIGVSIDNTFLKHLYPLSNLNRMIRNNYVGFAFVTIIIGISTYFFLNKISFLIILPIFAWYIYAYPMLLENKKLSKKIQYLYPNKSSKNNNST